MRIVKRIICMLVALTMLLTGYNVEAASKKISYGDGLKNRKMVTYKAIKQNIKHHFKDYSAFLKVEGESLEIKKDDLKNYVDEILPHHLYAYLGGEGKEAYINDYYYKDGHVLLNTEDESLLFFYPVYKGRSLKFVLWIYGCDGKFESMLDSEFANALDKIGSEKICNNTFFTDGSVVWMDDGKKPQDVYVWSNESSDNIESDLNEDIVEEERDVLNDIESLDENLDMMTTYLRGPVGKMDEKTVNVKGVSQIGPTCWAATCAALINYHNGTHLDCIDVAKYVYGHSWQKGGGWEEKKKAYNHWRLYPTHVNNVISFAKVKSNIKSDKPMDISLVTYSYPFEYHAVALIGYSDWINSENTERRRILVLLEPNGGVKKTVEMMDNGNIRYMLNEDYMKWDQTIMF